VVVAIRLDTLSNLGNVERYSPARIFLLVNQYHIDRSLRLSDAGGQVGLSADMNIHSTFRRTHCATVFKSGDSYSRHHLSVRLGI
jgi:hypothetical protein